MKMSINFRTFTSADLNLLEKWFEDEIVADQLEGKMPLERWCKAVSNNPNYHCWLASDSVIDQIVGIVCIDEYEEGKGGISVLTNPDLRRKGYGSKMVTSILQDMQLPQVKTIVAYISPDNTASLRCFEKAQFKRQADEDDMYVLTFNLRDLE